MIGELSGHEVFLRIGDGPIQCFRVWDAELFFEATIRRAVGEDPPQRVVHVSREAYMAERKAKR
jgi:hypothetical protein